MNLKEYRNFFPFFCSVVFFIVCVPYVSHAYSVEDNRSLIIYYSRTGNSRVVAEALHEKITGSLLELQDNKDRSGWIGFASAAFDAIFNRYTDIEPAFFDLSPYDSIILVTPIWNWKLSVAARTALEEYAFEGKRLFLVSLGNQHVGKYEMYDDDAPFMKRFFRDYLRGKYEAERLFVKKSGVIITGHYHINSENLTDDEMRDKALEGLEFILENLTADEKQHLIQG